MTKKNVKAQLKKSNKADSKKQKTNKVKRTKKGTIDFNGLVSFINSKNFTYRINKNCIRWSKALAKSPNRDIKTIELNNGQSEAGILPLSLVINKAYKLNKSQIKKFGLKGYKPDAPNTNIAMQKVLDTLSFYQVGNSNIKDMVKSIN